MSIAAQPVSPFQTIRTSVLVSVSLAGSACCLTLLFLGMRAVMDVGGFCAEGGPFEIRQECPEGVPLVMIGGIWVGVVFVFIYVQQTLKHKVPSFIGFAWPALFLSLGWNFLEYGLDPPGGGGPQWGWLVCAVMFGLMGGLPLLLVVRPTYNAFTSEPEEQPPVIPSRADTSKKLAAALRRLAANRSESAVSTTDPGDDEDMVGALERLDRLHKSGALSDAEFEAAKTQVLAQGRWR